jgi:hypothetical protein
LEEPEEARNLTPRRQNAKQTSGTEPAKTKAAEQSTAALQTKDHSFSSLLSSSRLGGFA